MEDKMEWQGSSSGPGWQDVADMALALDSLHGCSTTVQLSFGVWYGNPNLCAAIVSMRPSVSEPDQLLTCTTVVHYPTKAHKTVSGWLYGALHEQDRRIGKNWYVNQPLPQEPEPAQ